MSKSLVAYFSASKTTERVASKLAYAIQADLFEVKPVQPYSSADLDWNDTLSRSSQEMNDRDSRPAIRNTVSHMEQYDVVFVGFPIWWYREPSIIDTFMESYDFGGKTIVPFATSGGSGMGNSSENMQKLAPGSKVVTGMRFSDSVSEKRLQSWASQWL